MKESNDSSPKINLKQIYSLSALYASTVLGWIAYYNYQPQLLKNYNLENLTEFLFIAQGIILFITPMLAGRLGDKFRQSGKKRLPVISIGISLAAMIFMAVAVALAIKPTGLFIWFFPVFIVLWIFSMSLFTSPAISTIELFAPKERLIRVMAYIVFITGLIYALEPVIVDIVQYLGPITTFAGGGIAVTVTGYIFYKVTGDKVDIIIKENEDQNNQTNFSQIILFGLGFGLITTTIFNLVPSWVTNEYFSKGNLSASFILGLSAFLGFIFSKSLGNKTLRFFVVGILICAIGIVLLKFGPSSIDLLYLLILGTGYSLIALTGVPHAINVTSSEQKVFSVGVFYAFAELPNGIVEYLLIKGILN